ncbi:hypothetical protein H8356DRAFT_1049822 [Neocallimastix lanati (nom. inval.)]|nr:hypothetical protein H8356DRAFT_1049822 [Neocallimastix sp. JGI-2020a]
MIYSHPIQESENEEKCKIINNINSNSIRSNISNNNKNKTAPTINPPTVKRRGGPREGAGRKRKNGPKALTYTPTPEVAAFLNIKKRRNESIQQIITRCIMEYKSLEMTEIGHRNEVKYIIINIIN